jgi:hypothetical protein
MEKQLIKEAGIFLHQLSNGRKYLPVLVLLTTRN